MAATVTTPVAINPVTTLTPSTTIMPPVTAIAFNKTGAFPVVNITGVTHIVQPIPFRRWNGSTWVASYTPHQ